MDKQKIEIVFEDGDTLFISVDFMINPDTAWAIGRDLVSGAIEALSTSMDDEGLGKKLVHSISEVLKSIKANNEPTIDETHEEMRKKLNIPVHTLFFNNRIAQGLRSGSVTKVGELAQMTDANFSWIRNVGEISVNEVKVKLSEMGLSLGMAFDPDIFPPFKFDVDELVRKRIEQRSYSH